MIFTLATLQPTNTVGVGRGQEPVGGHAVQSSVGGERAGTGTVMTSHPAEDNQTEIETFLKNIELENLIYIFKKEHISMEDLISMDHDDLKQVGIKQYGYRNRIIKEIRGRKTFNCSMEEFLDHLDLQHLKPLFQVEKITMDMITTFGHTDLKEIGVVAYGDRYKVLNGIQNIQNMNNLKPISITSAHTGQSFGGQSVSLMADGDGRHHVNNKPKIDETRQDYAEDINKELDSILNELNQKPRNEESSKGDCGACKECLDKPKFGGNRKRRKPCILKSKNRKVQVVTQQIKKPNIHLPVFSASSTPIKLVAKTDISKSEPLDSDMTTVSPSSASLQNIMSTPIQQGTRSPPSFDMSNVVRPHQLSLQPTPDSTPSMSMFRANSPTLLRDHLKQVDTADTADTADADKQQGCELLDTEPKLEDECGHKGVEDTDNNDVNITIESKTDEEICDEKNPKNQDVLCHYLKLPVTKRDYLTLNRNKWVNDAIVDFVNQYYFHEVLAVEEQSKFKLFNTMFYKRISEKRNEKVLSSMSHVQRIHSRVKSWTSGVNIFKVESESGYNNNSNNNGINLTCYTSAQYILQFLVAAISALQVLISVCE